jgi:hypothetical protein
MAKLFAGHFERQIVNFREKNRNYEKLKSDFCLKVIGIGQAGLVLQCLKRSFFLYVDRNETFVHIYSSIIKHCLIIQRFVLNQRFSNE